MKNKSSSPLKKQLPVESKNRTFWVVIASIVVTFIAFMYIRSTCVLAGADYGVDVYYHIKAGDMFQFFSTTKQFPWTEMSVWKTNFYDKELGFHAVIYLLRQFSSLIGIPLSAPFNFIDGFFVATIIIVSAVGSWFYCRAASIIIAPLLIFISPFFFEKLCMIRPQLISIFLFTVVLLVLMLRDKMKLKCVLIFLLGWLYSYCYSVPHIVILPVLAYVIVSLILDKKFSNLFLLLFVIIGIAVGLTLHPQFPNTYKLWYIQGFEVVRKILGLSSSQVGLGMGLGAPTAKSLLQNSLIYVLLAVNFIFLLINRKINISKPTHNSKLQTKLKIQNLLSEARNKNRLAYNGLFLFVIQLIMLVGFLFSKRCIEYAVPAGVMCFVYIISNSDLKTPYTKLFRVVSNVKYLILSGLIFIVIMAPLTRSFLHYRTKSFKVYPLHSFASWADSNLKPGTYIGLLHWGDFPRLFYVAPQFKYSMALDPMFSYYSYPERTEVVEQFRLGHKKVGPKELSKALGTKLVYCSKFDHMAVMYLLERGAEVAYYDKQGCLLRL